MMIFELEFLFSFVPEARFIYLSIYLSRLSGFWLNTALFILQASPLSPSTSSSFWLYFIVITIFYNFEGPGVLYSITQFLRSS